MQRANKSKVYEMVGTLGGSVTAIDWGDRILLVKEPRGPREQAQRWVLHTGLPPQEMGNMLREQLRQWEVPGATPHTETGRGAMQQRRQQRQKGKEPAAQAHAKGGRQVIVNRVRLVGK
jgi:hypothetical protein